MSENPREKAIAKNQDEQPTTSRELSSLISRKGRNVLEARALSSRIVHVEFEDNA